MEYVDPFVRIQPLSSGNGNNKYTSYSVALLHMLEMYVLRSQCLCKAVIEGIRSSSDIILSPLMAWILSMNALCSNAGSD